MRVFSNLAISLDGKIADANLPSKALGTPFDRQMMQKIRQDADLILVGAGTLRAHPRAMKIKKKLSSKKAQPTNAVVTASGILDSRWPFWSDDSVIRIIFTTSEGMSRALESCQDRALVFDVGEEKINFKKVFQKLKELNYKSVLVEGGGELMAGIIAEDLLHELYVTLTPRIVGGRSNPSLVGGAAALWKNLELLKLKRVKDEMYFHYKMKGSKRV